MTDPVELLHRLDASLDPVALSRAAGRRYWTDPAFHARVKTVATLVEQGQPNDGFDRFDQQSVLIGVALALHLVEGGADHRMSADSTNQEGIR